MERVDLAPQPQPQTVDLAVVAGVLTPYRLHLHRRIVLEVPEVRLWSVLTHEKADQPWSLGETPEVRPICLGRGRAVGGPVTLRGALGDWRTGGRVIRWLGEHGARAVVVAGYNDPGRIRVIRWCRRRGIPCFLHADSNILSDNATGLKRLAKNAVVGWVVRRCAGVLPFGTAGARYFQRYGADPRRIFLLPCEPDYELVTGQSPQRIDATRARFSLSPDRHRFVCCGRLARAKRIDLAIDAFCAVARERPDWDLVIIGDGPLRSELQSRVPAGLASRVTWTGFLGDQADICAVYRCCHVLLHPSDFEPWALVVSEAAAAGHAIIASDVVGAAVDLVRDGVNGRIFPVGSLDRLIDAVRDVTSGERWRRMGTASTGVLAEWRWRGDPVAGLRRALAFAGILSPGAATEADS